MDFIFNLLYLLYNHEWQNTYTEFHTSSVGSSSHLLYFCFNDHFEALVLYFLLLGSLRKRWVKRWYVSPAFFVTRSRPVQTKMAADFGHLGLWRPSSDEAEPCCISYDAYGAAAVLSSPSHCPASCFFIWLFTRTLNSIKDSCIVWMAERAAILCSA